MSAEPVESAADAEPNWYDAAPSGWGEADGPPVGEDGTVDLTPADSWDALVAAKLEAAAAPAAPAAEPQVAPSSEAEPAWSDAQRALAESVGADLDELAAFVVANPQVKDFVPFPTAQSDEESIANLGALRAFQEGVSGAEVKRAREQVEGLKDQVFERFSGELEYASDRQALEVLNAALAALGRDDPRMHSLVNLFADANLTLASSWWSAAQEQQTAQEQAAREARESELRDRFYSEQARQAQADEAAAQEAVNEWVRSRGVTLEQATAMDALMAQQGLTPTSPDQVDSVLSYAFTLAKQLDHGELKKAEVASLLQDPFADAWVAPTMTRGEQIGWAVANAPLSVLDPERIVGSRVLGTEEAIREQTAAEFAGRAADDWRQANDNLGRLTSLIAQKPRRRAAAKGRHR